MEKTSLTFSCGTAPSEPRRVVVIGATDDFVKSTCLLLEFCGHAGRVAVNGRAGVELVKSVRPDVVLSSIELAGLEGFQVAQEIREAMPQKLLLVAHTSYPRNEIAARAKAAGFDFYLPKPASLEQLKKVVEASERLTESDEPWL